MSDQRALVRGATALELGIMGDALLRGVPWGVNLTIGVVVLATAATWLDESSAAARRDVRALLWAAAALSLVVTWRDAALLGAVNLAACGGLLLLAVGRANGLQLEAATVRGYLWAVGTGVARGVQGAFPSLRGWRPRPALGRRARSTAVGAGLALPVLAVFGVLFVAADPVFERAARSVLSWDGRRVASHLTVAAALSWLAYGFLFGLRARREVAPPAAQWRLARPLGLVEIGIPLGALATLFATFVGVQAGYLFGGDGFVQATTGLGYAHYARRGFFELVAVAVLVVPLLLAADAAIDHDDARTVRGFRVLAAMLLGLLALIVASALRRLWLYYAAYGLTPARIYAASLMLWGGLTLAWFAATVLRGRRGPFVLGATAAALGVLVSLNVLNPDAVVARVNVARAGAGAELDLQHLARLSGDGLPTLARVVGKLPDEARCRVAAALDARWRDASRDWRTWNVGRARAQSAVERIGARCPRPTG